MTLKVALIQSSLAWGQVDENLNIFEEKTAKCSGCDVILLPEMFVSGCMMTKKSREVAMAEKIQVALRYQDVRQMMQGWAKREDALVIGSTAYEEEGRYYNRLIAAFPDGYFLYYDKRHCFRMGSENEHFSAGNQHLVFNFRGAKIAAFICYDLRFPVWCRNVQDYDVALFIANWPESRREVWKTLLKARAIENQAYVAAVNCVGTDTNGLKYVGDSMVVDPRGNVVKSADEWQEEIVIVDCDMAALHEFRRKFQVLEDRDDFIISYR